MRRLLLITTVLLSGCTGEDNSWKSEIPRCIPNYISHFEIVQSRFDATTEDVVLEMINKGWTNISVIKNRVSGDCV